MNFRRFQLLNRDDQLVSAVILTLMAISMGIYWILFLFQNHGIIDFEDLPSREAELVVDINSAHWPELAILPGIGEKLAQSIVDHRSLNGSFTSPEQLIEVDGIGPKKMEAIQPFIRASINSGDP
ncbi:MAG: helix-hairpin-helix domain-containing protein [Planctomycetota bacterium]